MKNPIYAFIQFLLVIVVFFSESAQAGELVRDTTVLEVANTHSGGADFTVKVAGGTGACSGPQWITFPWSKRASDASFNQAFSIALAALAADKKVRIHNFTDSACNGANFISITK